MKLVCIRNQNNPVEVNREYKNMPQNKHLTVGKIYEGDTLSDPDEFFVKVDADDGNPHVYYRGLFITLEEYRQQQIDKIL